MARQSDPPPVVPADDGDVIRTRKSFAATVHARLEVLGIEPRDRVTWIVDGFEKRHAKIRWQTVQYWLDAVSFPQGRRLATLASVLGVNIAQLVGPLRELDGAPPAFDAFARGEGVSMTEEERWHLRMFQWPTEPTVGDYRGLLAVLRNNAERA